MTKAREYVAKVNQAVTEINAAEEYSQEVKRRITELRGVFESINTHAVQSLNELESQPFDSKRDAEKFRQVGTLMKSLIEIQLYPLFSIASATMSSTISGTSAYNPINGSLFS
ncbi:hypothetical protein [Anabaena sp. UHCC 0451]|uniref:hypothetical protein n=1 Tax=Anabaena sp. UHCC 0451 TaxID=2055235 RepID=UPI002B21A3D1|nr:hypothetical protein [Anabaena sp. UHCC 0451]MEA5578620.1 hypothetical protein [Anabaena sp. UHCC 0451]